jgi:beta-lactam-binding protein with PASTA domain
VRLPDFTFKHWPSVEACLKAADWKYTKKDVDENTFGQGSVLRQSPKVGEDIDPDNPPTITFEVSTGNPE